MFVPQVVPEAAGIPAVKHPELDVLQYKREHISCNNKLRKIIYKIANFCANVYTQILQQPILLHILIIHSKLQLF